MLYLPSRDGLSDTVVVHDRVNAQDPRTLANYSHYKSYDANAITTAPALKQWFLHMPVAPTTMGRVAQWPVSAKQQGRLTTLLPADAVAQIVDESGWWPTAPMPASERKWHLVIKPATDRQWDTFLNVVQAHDNAIVPTSDLVRTSTGDVDGALVHRPGSGDVLALFNAAVGPNLPGPTLVGDRSRFRPEVPGVLDAVRLRRTGYALAFSSNTASTDVFVLDLDPAKLWGVTVDNGLETPVVIGGDGVARAAVIGAGAHVLRVRAAGEPQTAVIVLLACP